MNPNSGIENRPLDTTVIEFLNMINDLYLNHYHYDREAPDGKQNWGGDKLVNSVIKVDFFAVWN